MTLSEYIDSNVDKFVSEMTETFSDQKDAIIASKDAISMIAKEASSWTIQFLQEYLNERGINTSTEEAKVDESDRKSVV